MEHKHTKGPWKIHDWLQHNVRIIGPDATQDGFVLTEKIGPTNNNTERNANAKLIAAAPCLLEALEALLRNTDAVYLDPAARNLAIKVIAKATGETE